MASIFGVTASDIQHKINPENDQYKFTVGSGADDSVTESYVDSIIETQESKVLSLLPELYRELITVVDGEILESNAVEGQTALQLGLFPIDSASLKLYLNYPSWISWISKDVTYLIDSADYVVDANTGVIALSYGLTEGDTVYAYYEHTAGSKILWIKDIVKDFVCYELALQLESITGPDGFDRFQKRYDNAVSWLNDIRKGSKSGISEIDALNMFNSRERRKAYWVDIYGIERPIKDILS